MNLDEPVILATVKDFKAPSLPPPLLSQRDELLKALESAKRLDPIKTTNLINYINFSNGSVSVILNHPVYKESILLRAIPEPCLGKEAIFRWADNRPSHLKLHEYIFEHIMIHDDQSIIIIPAKLIHMDETCLRVDLDDGYIVNRRRAKRYVCGDIKVSLRQSGSVTEGKLSDFDPLGFKVALNSKDGEPNIWFNPDNQIVVDIYRDNTMFFSGTCRFVRQNRETLPREIVLSASDETFNRFRKKPIRNPRHHISPTPTITFEHPFFKTKIQRDVFNISNSGLSVIENDNDGVLMVGMILPDLSINFTGILQSAVKCVGQVVNRQSDPDNGIICGIAILDMDIDNHGRLTHVMGILGEPHSRLSQEINPDKIWKFFFDTGFMYPDKYQHVHAIREEIKSVYETLYKDSPDIARHFTYEKKGRIMAHIAMLKAYTTTWVMHHHAARSSEDGFAGLKVLRQLVYYLNGLSRYPSAKTEYALGYYRPQNEFPNMVFGEFSRELNNVKGCSLDMLSYAIVSTKDSEAPLPGGCSLTDCSSYDIWELDRYYQHRSGGLLLDALGIKTGLMVDPGLEEHYRQLGFLRKCSTCSLSVNGTLTAVFIVDQSSPGMNLSDLLNGIKVIILKPELLSWRVLSCAVSRLSGVFPYDEVPLLIFPSDYVNIQNIKLEKQYQLCIINLRDNENDYMEYISRRFRMRPK